VVECPGLPLLDSIDHAIGEAYSGGMSADDIRVASCSPSPPCASTGGTTAWGMDLEFDIGLSPAATITSASMRIRAAPNNGDPGTTRIYDQATGTLLGSCTIFPAGGAQVYGQCTATLSTALLDNTRVRVYTDNGGVPSCYTVYDFFELIVVSM
jgi:hypothetical protein